MTAYTILIFECFHKFGRVLFTSPSPQRAGMSYIPQDSLSLLFLVVVHEELPYPYISHEQVFGREPPVYLLGNRPLPF